MPSGCVLRYDGKRGVVWKIKYRDGVGVQVKETIGAERDGVTRKQAEAELRDRVHRVERQGWRKPKPVTFTDYAEQWFAEGERKRGWKPKTLYAYRTVLRHLEAYFHQQPLGAVRPRDVAAYTRHALERFSAKTVNLHLNVLHGIYETAVAEEVVDGNPVARAERPKVKPRRWRILEPVEVGRVLRSFEDEQARMIFLTLVLTGMRRFELQGLRWRDVDLVDGVLRIRESKSEEGERSIALSPPLAEALWQHRRRSAFQGEDELVFCHSRRGSKIDHEWYAAEFRAALATAGVAGYERPFHDLRHASLTNGAAAGESPIALMTRAGHRNMKTTQVYLHLAGVVFRDEAASLADRLLGPNAVPNRYQPQVTSAHLAAPETAEQAGS